MSLSRYYITHNILYAERKTYRCLRASNLEKTFVGISCIELFLRNLRDAMCIVYKQEQYFKLYLYHYDCIVFVYVQICYFLCIFHAYLSYTLAIRIKKVNSTVIICDFDRLYIRVVEPNYIIYI